MHLLQCNLRLCGAASAKVRGSEEGWRGAINFVSSEKQCPMDSGMWISTSSCFARAFVTDQPLLPLPLSVITLKEAVSDSRLLHRTGAV